MHPTQFNHVYLFVCFKIIFCKYFPRENMILIFCFALGGKIMALSARIIENSIQRGPAWFKSNLQNVQACQNAIKIIPNIVYDSAELFTHFRAVMTSKCKEIISLHFVEAKYFKCVLCRFMYKDLFLDSPYIRLN